MENNNLILIDHFCLHNQVETSFINSLHDFGLIDFIIKDNNRYLLIDQLKEIEKMVDFHYTLNINIEGIDVIGNLLKQINELNYQLNIAKNKLSIYETIY